MTVPAVIGGAVCWRGGFCVDADGAPNAYHPDDIGLDYLANAGKPGDWYGIATNAYGIPVEQGAGDPAPGYYVSTTALRDPARAATDPRRYVDSTRVPYVSIAHDLLSRPAGVRVGDLAWVTYKDMEWGAIVADVGPHGKYGEGSIALADHLSIPSSPKRGGVDDGVTWIVFAGQTIGWPRSNDEILAAARSCFAAWGGEAGLARVPA